MSIIDLATVVFRAHQPGDAEEEEDVRPNIIPVNGAINFSGIKFRARVAAEDDLFSVSRPMLGVSMTKPLLPKDQFEKQHESLKKNFIRPGKKIEDLSIEDSYALALLALKQLRKQGTIPVRAQLMRDLNQII